jgi:hypothetical protein
MKQQVWRLSWHISVDPISMQPYQNELAVPTQYKKQVEALHLKLAISILMGAMLRPWKRWKLELLLLQIYCYCYPWLIFFRRLHHITGYLESLYSKVIIRKDWWTVPQQQAKESTVGPTSPRIWRDKTRQQLFFRATRAKICHHHILRSSQTQTTTLLP